MYRKSKSMFGKLLLLLLTLCCAIVLLFGLAACSETKGIASAVINDNGELVITYTDGTSDNLGVVVGKDGVDGEDGKDGQDGAPGKDGVDGEDGKDGQDGRRTRHIKGRVQRRRHQACHYIYGQHHAGDSHTRIRNAMQPRKR
ncbi:MAG: collagen-like protein [Subdoligranulum sp.]|nr:collagen-like protein [Subdoligranulum sp.]